MIVSHEDVNFNIFRNISIISFLDILVESLYKDYICFAKMYYSFPFVIMIHCRILQGDDSQ